MGYAEMIIDNINIDHKRNRNSQNSDCPIKLDKIHCQNCYFTLRGKCEYERIVKDEHPQAKT